MEWHLQLVDLFPRTRSVDMFPANKYKEIGNIEASFSSKMIATIDPNMPIWDRYVMQNLCLMNSFYKETAPDPHLHVHVRPRYDKPVMLNGSTYTDRQAYWQCFERRT